MIDLTVPAGDSGEHSANKGLMILVTGSLYSCSMPGGRAPGYDELTFDKAAYGT